MADHSIRMVTLVNPEEYLSAQSMADDDGLSDSAFIRFLIRQEARKRAAAKYSDRNGAVATAEPAHVVHSRFHTER